MMNVDSGWFQVRRPTVHEQIDKNTVRKLAERLFRKNLAAQYVTQDHGFLVVEDKLIHESVCEIRRQLVGITMVHLTIAGIHLMVMDAAGVEAECAAENHDDIDECTIECALDGVERDSLDVLAALALPE